MLLDMPELDVPEDVPELHVPELHVPDDVPELDAPETFSCDGAAQTEEVVKVEEFDGSYDCLICSESVRGKDARRCSACTCQPWHTACAPGLSVCPQCSRSSVAPLKSGRRAQSAVLAPEQSPKT